MAEWTITFQALRAPGEIRKGHDLASDLVSCAGSRRISSGDIIVVSHKAVSKAEGRVRRLSEVEPGDEARALAAEQDRDPRQVQAILDESSRVVRAEHGVLICVTHHGFVCANAGVDSSNSNDPDELVLLPVDPDLSARKLRSRLAELTGVSPAVVVTDSFGRAWRLGQVDTAIGCAGLQPLDDWRGRTDRAGAQLEATEIAVADSVAAAADLAREKDSGQPFVVVSGLDRFVIEADGPGAAALRRPTAEDMFLR